MSADAKAPAPPVTPDAPPQLVACGDRDFYRITQSSLQVFEIAPQLPPPQIRGSKIARQTTEVAVGEPSNVFSVGKRSVLVIAHEGVFRYELGQTRARRYAPIQGRGPLIAWPDPRRPGAFRVRAVGDESLQVYALSRLESGDAGSPSDRAKASPDVERLPEFDARLFTVLADGTPLYSTPGGLVRRGHESRPVPVPELSGPATILFADSAPDRYWTADASGRLALWEAKQGASPVFASSVPGVVIDAAQDGDRVAVLSMELAGESYRPTVTIFSNGKEQTRLSIGPSIASRGQPKLDLCLIAGRPWVLVGGTRWLQLLDWDTRRLLAEW